MNEIENQALGQIVHAQGLVGLGNVIIIASSRGKPSELHVVLNSVKSMLQTPDPSISKIILCRLPGHFDSNQ